MSISKETSKSLPDQFDEFTQRLAARGITITPLPGLGVWGFSAQKGAQQLRLFWDYREDLLVVERPGRSGPSEPDCCHPLTNMTRDRVLAFVYDFLVNRFSTAPPKG